MKKLYCVVFAIFMVCATFSQPKYEIKSGIVKSCTEIMGNKVEATAYFDNYGELEASKTKLVTPAGEFDISTISKEGKVYIVNNTEKQVQEIPAPETVNYTNLTPEIIENFKIKELGKETIGDKECTKYSVLTEQMGQTFQGTTYVWKGYVIKSVIDLQGNQIVTEVTDFNVDAYVLPENFQVPTF